MLPREGFLESLINMERALGNTLRAAAQTGTPRQIEHITGLLIKKEIILASLLEKVNTIYSDRQR
ncbi:MAG TPA: hypothetical protein VIG80_05760 [Bacillaceae bacterium]